MRLIKPSHVARRAFFSFSLAEGYLRIHHVAMRTSRIRNVRHILRNLTLAGKDIARSRVFNICRRKIMESDSRDGYVAKRLHLSCEIK